MASDKGFELWFSENKGSEELRGRYAECCNDMEQIREKKPSFKRWMEQVYNSDPDIQLTENDIECAG